MEREKGLGKIIFFFFSSFAFALLFLRAGIMILSSSLLLSSVLRRRLRRLPRDSRRFQEAQTPKRNVFKSDKEITLDMEILAQWTDSQWYPARVIRISKTKPRVSKKNLTLKFSGIFKRKTRFCVLFLSLPLIEVMNYNTF